MLSGNIGDNSSYLAFDVDLLLDTLVIRDGSAFGNNENTADVGLDDYGGLSL